MRKLQKQKGRWLLKLRDGTPGKRCHTDGCGNPAPKGKAGNHCSSCRMRRWRLNNPERAAFAHVKESAKRRHIPFHLTFDQFHAFGKKHRYFDRKGRAKWNMSIDRIDSRLGYSLDNICVITVSENSIKGTKERHNAHIRRALMKKGVDPQYWPEHLREMDAQQEIDMPF